MEWFRWTAQVYLVPHGDIHTQPNPMHPTYSPTVLHLSKMCFREEKDEICNSLLLGICISLICEILIIPWTNSLPLLVRLHQIIVLPCPYPIHDSLLLFHQLKAPHLVRSWSNNASSLPPPFCNRAEHHQSHPESLQDKKFLIRVPTKCHKSGLLNQTSGASRV